MADAALFAAVHRPSNKGASSLTSFADDFSPRYECHGADLVVIDVSGLTTLLGDALAIGRELRRSARVRGLTVQVAIARTQTAATILARVRPGLTVVPPGAERETLSSVRLEQAGAFGPDASACGHAEPRTCISEASASASVRGGGGAPPPVNKASACGHAEPRTWASEASASASVRGGGGAPPPVNKASACDQALASFKTWGLTTLGELAALPAADLVARLGPQALAWQAMARGEDLVPLVPTREEERFESTLALEWPIDGLEPLSFVLTRLLEPLSIRLERRDRGAAVLHVLLQLVTRDLYARRLELPSPLRDVRTLRTLALLDLESHPPSAAIDRVTVLIDPTPGRIVQHTLFTRPQPTPDQLATLLARLHAVMGQDRVGAPAEADSHEPDAFVMRPFRAMDTGASVAADPAPDARRCERNASQALRRCRRPIAARVVVADGVPVRLTTDRGSSLSGPIVRAAGPWRTSGGWWAAGDASDRDTARPAAIASGNLQRVSGRNTPDDDGDVPAPSAPRERRPAAWNRDEWDIALADGTVCRVFQDRHTEAWFVDAIVD